MKRLTLTGVLHRVRQAEMPALEKFAFLMLLTSANHRTFGNARPAMRVLASTLGRSLSCTRNAVSALRYNGLIAPVGSNRGGFAPTLWQLHPERLGRPWQEPPVAHQTTGGPRLKTIGDPARFPKGGPRLKTSPDQRTYSAATFTSGVEGIVRRPRAHGQRGELGAIRGVVPSSPDGEWAGEGKADPEAGEKTCSNGASTRYGDDED